MVKSRSFTVIGHSVWNCFLPASRNYHPLSLTHLSHTVPFNFFVPLNKIVLYIILYSAAIKLITMKITINNMLNYNQYTYPSSEK